ncbi:acyl-CoA thioesterase [Mycoplasmatota bacterium]|nr:acyl-CoA thioesterase [Mycoplasmatota bacterium]
MFKEKEIEVRYAETDQMGVVYHGNYVVWYDIGRTHFYEDFGFSMQEDDKNGLVYPVRDISIRYLSPVRFGEKIKVTTKIHKLKKASTIYYQEIVNFEGELKSTCYVTVAAVDKITFKLMRLSEVRPDIYEKYLEYYKE